MSNIQYKTADQLPLMEEVTDNTYALVEENGTLKRVSGSNLGGSGVKTAIIKTSDYDNTIAGIQTMSASTPAVTYSCVNMTFEEAYQTMANGEPLQAILMAPLEGGMCLPSIMCFMGDAILGMPALAIRCTIGSSTVAELYWTADGISTTQPSVPT